MSERKIYDPSRPTQPRGEWVDFSDGRSIYVRGLTAAQYASLKSRAARSPGDPRGGEDPAAAILIQIVLSCYDGEGADARRIYSDLDLDKAGALSFDEFLLVMGAVNRVNGMDATVQELMRDFTTARAERLTSP